VNKVSVILCVYNAEKTLSATLDSLLRQTFTGYQLVVVDDGSTDGSALILDAYSSQFAEIKIIHQANLGPGPARNTAIAVASYDLLAFIDSDDIWHESKLAKQLEVFKEHADVVCVITDCQEFHDDGELEAISDVVDASLSVSRDVDLFFRLAEVNFDFQPMTALWKKSIFTDFGGFTNDKSGQDYYPFLVVALHDLAFYRIQQPLYFVRVSRNSVSRSRMSPYYGALARVEAIDRIISLETARHEPYLTKAKRASLDKGQQKFLRWVLYGVRVGFPKSKMPSLYFSYLFRIKDKKILVLEFFKLLAVLVFGCR
jgi:glycosyltransferase involved in cell wall biosynthesis